MYEAAAPSRWRGGSERLQDYATLLKVRKERASTGLRRVALGEEGAGVYKAAPPSWRGGGSGRQQRRTAIHEVRRVWVSTGLRRFASVESCGHVPGCTAFLEVRRVWALARAGPPRRW
jgi:hypothetical protein